MATMPAPTDRDLCRLLRANLAHLDELDRQRSATIKAIQIDCQALARVRGVGFIRPESIRQELGTRPAYPET